MDFARFMSEMSLFSTIPRRFKGKTIDNFKAKLKRQLEIQDQCKKYIDNFSKALELGTSLVFCGKPGTGKTHIAYGMVQALVEQQRVAILAPAGEITGYIKSGYRSDEGQSPEELTRKFCEIEFLAIDEVGVQIDSDAERRIFFNIINRRYEEMLPTLLISNLMKNELTQFVGERVMDRMREGRGVVFAFDWDSHRQ